ncbi:MAG TPA: AarF/UbiB family protein, partial [Nevskiaceae bacterium]|nr:AarF/UbiB family protein [Nevskiaceae bacterium]
YAGDPKIVIPATVPERCSARILTMELERGDALDLLGDAYDQELRNTLAVRLFHFMSRSLFELRAVHADPNPGNFAFRPDGTLVVYDFGCIKRLDDDSIAAYRATVQAALTENWPAVDTGLFRLGARVPGSAPVEGAFYAQWRKIIMRPFISDVPYDFATSTMHQEVMARSPEVLKRLDQFQPAVKTAYVDRMVGGHYWTLVRLKACVALAPLLRQYLG